MIFPEFDQIINPYLIMFVVMALGGSINLVYTFMRFHWANTPGQRCVAMLLPLLTLVISMTIANNLALSLGMIGALSIVRFRNPVKSPFELVTFFSYIVIGISAFVHLNFALAVWLATIVVPVGNAILSKTFKSFFSHTEEIDADKHFCTFTIIDVQDSFSEFLQRKSSNVKTLYKAAKEDTEGGETARTEVTFSVQNIAEYEQFAKELEQCATILHSALQRY